MHKTWFVNKLAVESYSGKIGPEAIITPVWKIYRTT
jgi:hypothetical protein